MSDNSENEDIEESLEVPLTKQKINSSLRSGGDVGGKAPRPRSQAQIEAFEKVKEKRRQNLEAKKQEKLINSAKLLLEEETKKTSRVEHEVPLKKSQPKKKVKHVEPEPKSESESEEEVIVVKKSKPVKKQKKVRKIIIEESSSEDEDEEIEYEPEPPQRPQRKPIVRVIRPNPNDFFC